MPSSGPWTERRIKYETYQIADKNGAEVAIVTRPGDARLIAAAPRMLELLRRLVDHELTRDGYQRYANISRDADALIAEIESELDK